MKVLKIIPYGLIVILATCLFFFAFDRKNSEKLHVVKFDDDLIVENVKKIFFLNDKSDGREILILQISGEFQFTKSINLVEVAIDSKDQIPSYLNTVLGVPIGSQIFSHFKTFPVVVGQWNGRPIVVTDDRKTILLNATKVAR